MAHKHNRRRMRTRSRNHNTFLNQSSSDRSHLSDSSITSNTAPPSPGTSYSGTRTALATNVKLRPTGLTANHWQNRYVAWQKRDKTQKEEAAKLEAEQIKLFGGVPGDDVGLCYRMLEYFGGLDFIDT